MNARILCVIIVAAGLFVATVQAQPTTKPASVKVEPVIDHIPAGALGFIVIKDVAGAAGKVDQYIKDIGFGEPMKENLPDGILGALKMLPIGEINIAGGLAVVMLDPNAFGVDLVGMMGLPEPSNYDRMIMGQTDTDADDADDSEDEDDAATKPAKPTTSPGAKPANAAATRPSGSTDPNDLPVVLLVAASGVSELLPMAVDDGGGIFKIEIGPVRLFGAKTGNYVALGISRKAVEAITKANKFVAGELSKEQAAILAASDLAVRLNMNVASPTATQLVAWFEKMVHGSPFFLLSLPPAAVLYPQMPFYRYAMGEMESFTVALRIEKTGLAADVLVDWKTDSLFAKAYADCKDCPPLGTRLPDRKSVMTIAAAPEGGPSGRALDAKRAESAQQMLSRLSEDEQKKVMGLAADVAAQVDRWEIVFGGGEEGGGVFSIALVLQGKDPDKIKKAMAEVIQTAPGLIFSGMAGSNEFDSHINMEFVKDAETLDGLAVDAIEFSPKGQDLRERDLEEMEKIMGERKIRCLMAAADDKTVVVTMGGGTKFLAEAIKAAKGEGKVVKAQTAAESLKFLPAKPSTLILFNGANMFDSVIHAYTTMSGEKSEAPVNFTVKTPIAYGSVVIGKQKHGVLYVPTALVKEAVKAYYDMEKWNHERYGRYRNDGPSTTPPDKNDF